MRKPASVHRSVSRTTSQPQNRRARDGRRADRQQPGRGRDGRQRGAQRPAVDHPARLYQEVETDGWNREDAFNILANPYTTTRPAVDLDEREQFIQFEEPFTDEFLLADLNIGYDFSNVALTSTAIKKPASSLGERRPAGWIERSCGLRRPGRPVHDRRDRRLHREDGFVHRELQRDGAGVVLDADRGGAVRAPRAMEPLG